MRAPSARTVALASVGDVSHGGCTDPACRARFVPVRLRRVRSKISRTAPRWAGRTAPGVCAEVGRGGVWLWLARSLGTASGRAAAWRSAPSPPAGRVVGGTPAVRTMQVWARRRSEADKAAGRCAVSARRCAACRSPVLRVCPGLPWPCRPPSTRAGPRAVGRARASSPARPARGWPSTTAAAAGPGPAISCPHSR